MINGALCAALVAAGAAAGRYARDPWWVIGSAAVALHGLDPGEVGDVDLLTSARDAHALLAAAGTAADSKSDRSRYRSVFGRWPAGALVIEVMGALEVYDGAIWRAVTPATRESVRVDGAHLFVPSRAELAGIMRLLGRPKDFARAALLDG